jgi:plasmid stabilization system protein ParE
MKYEVKISASAERDIEEILEFISNGSKVHATKWIVEFELKIASLRELPLRHALIEESAQVGLKLRSLLHHSHRIIYFVNEEKDLVEIVRVYHGSRKPLSFDDL